METADTLAAVNALLNGISGIALVTGWVLIKRGRRDAHKKAHRDGLEGVEEALGLVQ